MKLEGRRKLYSPKATDVKCEEHGVVTTWGALNEIQRLALKEGLDTTTDLPCLFRPADSGSNDA